MLALEELKKWPFLIYANKQDLPYAMTPSEVENSLGLEEFKDRKWLVQGSWAITSEGLYEGLEWITTIFDIKPKASSFLMFLLFIL